MSLTTDLISYWKLDESSGATAVDSVGSNDLTNNNTVGTATGKINTARTFDRDFSRYLSSTSTDLQAGSGSFAFTFWVSFQNPFGGFDELITKDVNTPADSRDYNIDYDGVAHLLRFYIDGGATDICSVSFNATGDTSWHFIAAWLDTSVSGHHTLNISLDDGTPGSMDIGNDIATSSTAEFCIGRQAYSGAELYFTGYIDEVGFWRRALSSAEITALYNGGAGLALADFDAGPTPQALTADMATVAAAISKQTNKTLTAVV